MRQKVSLVATVLPQTRLPHEPVRTAQPRDSGEASRASGEKVPLQSVLVFRFLS